MSALSKFSTTKRPRWAAGTGGTVGGGGVGSFFGGPGGRPGVSTVRGPTETGGAGGRAGPGGVLGSTVTETAGGAGGVSFGGAAQPASRDTRTTAAITSVGRR